jgi:Cu/Ag efflux pump CusA
LVFGLASSTALTLLVIPAIYIWLRDDERPAKDLASTHPSNKEPS